MEKLLRILKTNFFLFFLIIISCIELQGQEKKAEFTLSGYINYLPSYLEFERLNKKEFQTNHLIHNRLNIRGYIQENFSIGLELRNRILFDEGSFNTDDGYFDLSHYFINNSKFKLHSIVFVLFSKLNSQLSTLLLTLILGAVFLNCAKTSKTIFIYTNITCSIIRFTSHTGTY